MTEYRINEDKNGVEVEFTTKPDGETLDALKAAGFRWSKFGGYWYAKQTPERIALAMNLADGVQTAAQTPRKGAKTPQGTPQNRIKVYYNGLRLDGGKTLVKCYYSLSSDGSITIYARDYSGDLPRDLFNVKNDTDIYTDYFDEDRATVTPEHPLYAYIAYAEASASAKSAKRHIEKYLDPKLAEREHFHGAHDYYRKEKAQSLDTIARFERMTDPGQPTAEDLAKIDRERQEAENARRAAEQAEELRRREEYLAERAEGRRFIEATAAAHPITEGAPVVTVRWSEAAAFASYEEDALKISLAAAEIIFTHFDTARAEKNAAEGRGGYDKTAFKIEYTDENGEENTYEGRYDLGDNEGGLLAHLKAWAEYRKGNPFKKSAEDAAEDVATMEKWLDLLGAEIAPAEEGGEEKRTEEPAPDRSGIYNTDTHTDEDGREWFTINGDTSYPLDEWTEAEAIADYTSPAGIMVREIETRRAWGFYD